MKSAYQTTLPLKKLEVSKLKRLFNGSYEFTSFMEYILVLQHTQRSKKHIVVDIRNQISNPQQKDKKEWNRIMYQLLE